PLGVLTVICGVAGSGKSSLAKEIYQKAQADNQEIIHLSQKSITANLRSTPMTYLNIFDKVRKRFADLIKNIEFGHWCGSESCGNAV
ncbi:hypothetical protein ACOYYK_21355, partial [Enterococcus gallinarum]